MKQAEGRTDAVKRAGVVDTLGGGVHGLADNGVELQPLIEGVAEIQAVKSTQYAARIASLTSEAATQTGSCVCQVGIGIGNTQVVAGAGCFVLQIVSVSTAEAGTEIEALATTPGVDIHVGVER